MKSLGYATDMSKYHKCRYMEHGLEYILRILCLKTYGTLGGLFWSLAGSRQAAGSTRICETCIFWEN